MTPFSPDELASLPVFPLPRVVFFPGSVLPLHLFEPRYRAMVEACIESGSLAMAVALLQPGFEADYEGRPPIFPVAGAGRIVEHQRNDDGTFDIILQGITRVRLEESAEEPERPFRMASATPMVDTGSVSAPLVSTLISCATRVASVVRQRHPTFELGIGPDDETSQIIDTLADRFVAQVEVRQSILEASDLMDRFDHTLGAITELLASLASSATPS